MHKDSSSLRFIVAAIVVIVLGGLAGWYLFINKQITATETQDGARGFNDSQTFSAGIGNGISNIVGSVIGDILNTDQKGSSEAPRLWQITRTPVAGLGFASSTDALYFAERASGNILRAEAKTSKVERLTNTLIPKTIEALFARDGSVVLRSIGDDEGIVSFAAVIATSSSPATGDTPNKLDGAYLPSEILSISGRSSPKELFYVTREGDGVIGVTSGWLGSGLKQIFASALSDWNVIELADGAKYVAQKPSDDVTGYAFRLLSNGTLEQVVSGLPGLSILPRTNSSAMLYSTVSNGNLSLFGRTSDKSTDFRLPVRTVVDKCVWAPDSRLIAYCAVPQNIPSRTYLRDWYDGSAHSTDVFWKVDVSANTAEQIYTPEAGSVIDVEDMHVNDAGTYLAFINNADKTLWMLKIDK